MMTNFHLNTAVVAIFPNVCLQRRSLCSDLVLTLKNRIEPPSYAGLCFCNMAVISFRLFRKNLGNLRDFRCHCNPDDDKFSSQYSCGRNFSKCLFIATQFMLRLGIDPEKPYRATFICRPMFLQYGRHFFSTLS